MWCRIIGAEMYGFVFYRKVRAGFHLMAIPARIGVVCKAQLEQ
jgi:hypothetical protein